MQEIARGVYIETAYPGVTLGAINLPHGLILIDAPPRMDDARIWRSTLLNLGGGVERLLVNLDTHLDRTLGVRAMECTVVAHKKTALVYRSRSTTFKAQTAETGAEWEQMGGLGSVRWAPPEISFSHCMNVHWGDIPVIMEYHPGPNPGAIWVILPDLKVAFIGDLVVPNQPPFLANADLPVWIDTLQHLLNPAYREYFLVGGRSGLIPIEQIRRQIEILRRVQERLEQLAARNAAPEEVEPLVSGLLKPMAIPEHSLQQYPKRLRWRV